MDDLWHGGLFARLLKVKVGLRSRKEGHEVVWYNKIIELGMRSRELGREESSDRKQLNNFLFETMFFSFVCVMYVSVVVRMCCENAAVYRTS